MQLHELLKEDDRLSIRKKLKIAKEEIKKLEQELMEAESEQRSGEMLASEMEERRKKFGLVYKAQEKR